MAYLPADFTLTEEAGTRCGNKILLYYQTYEGTGGEIEIGRHNRLVIESVAPEDQMESIDINGVSAVLVRGVSATNASENLQAPWRLYIPYDDTVIEIVGRGISLDEGTKIVKSLNL